MLCCLQFFFIYRIEAAILGCFPLCPWKLSYPEIFPEDCLYRTEHQLLKRLKYFCKNPYASRNLSLNLEKFTWKSLKSAYEDILLNNKEVTTVTTISG